MRYTVLTYIFNGYESVHEIQDRDPDADYVLVTDDPTLKSDTWRVVLDQTPGRSPFGKCYEVRFHPFRYVNTDIVIRIDGSIQVLKSLKPLVDEFERGRYDRCLMIHPRRDTIPAEYDIWIRYRRYPRIQAARCLQAMQRMGYDFKYRGLYQGCLEIVRNNAVNIDINDQVFGMLCLLGESGKIERLDQTVFSAVINRFYSDRLKVMPVSEDIITRHDLLQWHQHNSTTPVPNVKDKIKPYLFDKPCKIWR